MSEPLHGLIGCLVGGAVTLVIAALIRIRGPRGLVNGVDWNRVSNIDGLGQFVSTMLIGVGALVMALGAVLFVWQGDLVLRDTVAGVLAVLLTCFGGAIAIGVRRYQDKPAPRKSDGRR